MEKADAWVSAFSMRQKLCKDMLPESGLINDDVCSDPGFGIPALPSVVFKPFPISVDWTEKCFP